MSARGKRPVGAKCHFKNVSLNNTFTEGNIQTDDMNSGLTDPDRATSQIRNNDNLTVLEAVSSRLSAIEERIERTEEKLESQPTKVSGS